MAKLQIFVDKTPIYSKSSITLKAGFFADDYSLTDVTANCSFSVDFGKDTVTQTQNNQFFVNTLGDVGFKAIYTVPKLQQSVAELETQYIATISLVIIGDATLPTKDDLYACIKREEPEGVYNQAADIASFTYLDNQAVADIFATLYQNLATEANQVYPELTTDYTDWISTLFSEVYINTEQGQINKVLQFLRNLQILTSMNPFDIAWAITSYIYYRTNLAIYVFIQENKVNFDKAWILGTDQSMLGVNTYLQQNQIQSNLIINVFDTEHQLDEQFKIELENFISKITRAYFGYTIDYDKTLEECNLNYDIGMTYKGDQRVIYSYCLKYSQSAFYEVIGLINPVQQNYIKEMLITPSDGTTINTPTKLTITGVFVDGVTTEITLFCQIIKSNDNLKIVGDILIPNKNGECTLTITYGNITQLVTYISEVT